MRDVCLNGLKSNSVAVDWVDAIIKHGKQEHEKNVM